MNLNTLLKNSKGLSPVFGVLILLAAGVAVSLASATWTQSWTYSFMKYEELEITGLHFYDMQWQDTPFPDLPEVKVTGTHKNVIIDEPSDIKILGSFNNVTVIGKKHNIWYSGGHNNLTLVSPGTILIDIMNPYTTITQIPRGWLLEASHPTGRPVIRGDIYLDTKGCPAKPVYIIGGQVVLCDNTYSAAAVTVKNIGTCTAEITELLLKWKPVNANPVPCIVQAGSGISISISSTWVAGEIYRISLVTSKGNMFNFAEVAE